MAEFDKINIDDASYNVKDTIARQQIADEIAARKQADTQLQQAITAEQTARKQAITAEQTARQQDIAAEQTAREQADKFLSTLSLRRATAKVHKTVGHFCAYETNFMGIASSC